MKVKRLELKGFRGFDEIVLDFDVTPGRATVFIGNNGVGKSSILDGLAILLSYFVGLLGKQEKFRQQEKSWEIGKEVDYQEHNKNNENCELIIHVEGEDKTDYKWTIRPMFHMNLGELNELVNSIIDNQVDSIKSIPTVIYYSVNRFIPEVYFDDSNNNYSESIFDTYDNSLSYCTPTTQSFQGIGLPPPPQIPFAPMSSVIPSRSPQPTSLFSRRYKSSLQQKTINFDIFFEWFMYSEDLENEQIRDVQNYRDKKLVAVRNAIYSIIPEFSNIRIRRSSSTMTVNKTIGDKVEELTINQLSDGEKCLLAMVGDIARRLAIANPGLDDPLQGEGIVLIDEIELHLHPQWQHRIIPRLTETFPNCQFIVTTHSPLVLGHVRPENIYILQSDTHGITAYHPESSYGRDSNQNLENNMGVTSRPLEINEQILLLFRLLAQNDLSGARTLRDKISAEIGSDPELIKANMVIKRKEVLGK